MNMNLGMNLKFQRERSKLTQEDVAKVLNVSRQSISKWERGEAEPNLATLQELCKIYKCDINDLINKNEASLVKRPTLLSINLFVFLCIFLTIFIVFLIFYIIQICALINASENGIRGIGLYFKSSELTKIVISYANSQGACVGYISSDGSVVITDAAEYGNMQTSLLGKYTLSGDYYWFNGTLAIIKNPNAHHVFLYIWIAALCIATLIFVAWFIYKQSYKKKNDSIKSGISQRKS